MNKENILKVVEKIISQPERMRSVVKNSDYDIEEYYFTYPEDKYLWSVVKNSQGEYYLFYYPSKEDKSQYIRFSGAELGFTGDQLIRKLMDISESKLYGFDSVVRDILDN